MSRSLARYGVALVAVVLVVSGCFNYIPTEFQAVPTDERVRVLVTPSVVNEMEGITTVRGRQLSGTVVRRDEEELFLRIPIVSRQEGFHSAELGQDVRIPQGEILEMERREFDRMGTGALVAGTIGAAATIVFYIMKAFGEEDDPGEVCPDCNGNGSMIRGPGISFPIR